MTTHVMRLSAADRWLQALLTWTPGQTDMIKTVALVLMVTDHAGLLLAHNNEIMRLLGGDVFRCSVWCGG
ncbi:conjugal transfer pilus acetylation protein TraX [Raoultella planticola]|uniref:Conjugal transfer pilus acetylation protein TraX n=1 Tax=Raoultella planticola TaxID=575 RepID=A0A485D4D7_RAOPL|nr:conjugal transfer pilus acetylation protein TraX [Raoultella planticola]